MNKLFRPKCMRRMAVFLALVAPIVYLFGVSIAGLAGAHGNSPFDSDTEIVVDNRKVDYCQLADVADFSYLYNGVNCHSSGGDIVFVGDCNGNGWFTFCNVPVVANHVYCITTFSNGTSQSGSTWQIYANLSFGSSIYTLNTYYLVTPDVNGTITLRGAIYPGYIDCTFSINVFDLSQMYPASPTYQSLANDYALGVAQPYSTSRVDYFPVYAVPDGSQYWFSQFFASDNFLVRWGENAISENPYGFAPFGYFWRYLDNNVLHLSNEQVGLMAYGYMYYAAHVLLFDVGFILVTFFLTFIQKVADKIGGEDHA